MRQGSSGWLVAFVVLAVPAAAALGQVGPDALGPAGIRGSSGTCGFVGGRRVFDAGDGPLSVAMGDLDGDGALDLVVAGGEIAVLLGDGSGSFTEPELFDAGETPISVAIGDLNGDGDLDLAVANQLFGNTAYPTDLSKKLFMPSSLFLISATTSATASSSSAASSESQAQPVAVRLKAATAADAISTLFIVFPSIVTADPGRPAFVVAIHCTRTPATTNPTVFVASLGSSKHVGNRRKYCPLGLLSSSRSRVIKDA